MTGLANILSTIILSSFFLGSVYGQSSSSITVSRANLVHVCCAEDGAQSRFFQMTFFVSNPAELKELMVTGLDESGNELWDFSVSTVTDGGAVFVGRAVPKYLIDHGTGHVDLEIPAVLIDQIDKVKLVGVDNGGSKSNAVNAPFDFELEFTR